MSPQPSRTPSDESASRPREASAVERVCRAVTGSEHEDCEQEVFARVWAKAALFDPARGSAAAWLLTLARRTALNQLAARRPPIPVDAEPAPDSVEPVDVDAFWLDTALARL